MSKIINCKSCYNKIMSNTKTCPKCGAKNKKPFYKRWWFIIIVVVLLLSSCSSNDVKDGVNDGLKNSMKTEEKNNQAESQNNKKQSDDTNVNEESTNDQELSYESAKLLVLTALEKSFGKNGTVQTYEQDDITMFSIPAPQGTAMGVSLLGTTLETDDLRDSYESMKKTFLELSKVAYEAGRRCNKQFAISIQNDQNPDNVILTIINGEIVYELAK